MNWRPSNSDSSTSAAFSRLDERIQRWIWTQGWNELREIQEVAIDSILTGASDLIISAATAGGKTEAAFLPILSRLLQGGDDQGLVLYVSPLKALINDQWDRLDRLCESLDISVHPWHGDISASHRQKFMKRPSGVLLITPESLESMFVNRGTGLSGLLSRLSYVVIDELHAFIGTERGKQLQSLLHRVELICGQRICRIGLSATLGDMELTRVFLRPNDPDNVQLLVSRDGSKELKLIVKGYVETGEVTPPSDDKGETEIVVPTAQRQIADDLFKVLRGSNNLVFPNSRSKVETYADLLRAKCESSGVPNEFWPHHGSLSKGLREETERALKSKERPASAVCTTTLELGIDIGTVKSIGQIGVAPSVASLRQRLGRSGRRNEPAILRIYVIEPEQNSDLPISDLLRETLVHNIASVNLLLRSWYEPPRLQGMYLSTLVQQVVSLIAERGGVTAQQTWKILCDEGTFQNVTPDDFVELLKELGRREVLMQQQDGLLLHGVLGEKIVNHYSFYASFVTEEEFRVVHGGKTLGTLPVSRPLMRDSFIIFAGRRWRVAAIDASQKVIDVTPAPGGRPPSFDGGTGKVHDTVRREMRQIFESPDVPTYLDAKAQDLLGEGRDWYGRLGLKAASLIERDAGFYLFTWRGDWVQDTLTLMLKSRGITTLNEGACLYAMNCERDFLLDQITDIAEGGIPDALELAMTVQNRVKEKWDWLLTDRLQAANFAASQLDVEGAIEACKALAAEFAHS